MDIPIEDEHLCTLDISIVQLEWMNLFVEQHKSVHYPISERQVFRIEKPHYDDDDDDEIEDRIQLNWYLIKNEITVYVPAVEMRN